MQNFLAIDAGGTSTRAVIVDASGRCLGFGAAGGGNPVSSGFDVAAESVLTATRQALQGSGAATVPLQLGVLAMAGGSAQNWSEKFQERLLVVGLSGLVVIEADLLAAYYAGTFHDDGYALIAGTGAVAARIRSGELAAVADGAGWLLGDSGSGFWLGRQVARAVSAALDGRGPDTALTGLLLAELGIDAAADGGAGTAGEAQAGNPLPGRAGVQQRLISAIYQLRPIELARFAPLAFAAAEAHDAVATDIVGRAGRALAGTLAAVTDPQLPGPLVFGGSVLTKGAAVAAAVRAALRADAAGTGPGVAWKPEIITVSDGVAGAAVLALKRAGIAVNAEVFGRVQQTLAALRG